MIMSEPCGKDDDYVSCSKAVDMGKLPPCRRSLEQHIRRVNYQLGIRKREQIANPDVRAASDGHGWILVDGKLDPFWYEVCVLSQQLADIAEGSLDISVEDSDSEEVYTPPDLDYPNGDCSESNED